jgi:membrane protease YdiL (CAAX protease family)
MLVRPIAHASRSTLTPRRALLELTLSYILILLVIWTPSPWQRIFYIAAVIALTTILALSFQSARALGLQRTNLGRSLWVAIVALILAAIIFLTAAHLHTLRAPHSASQFFARYWGYALWAFVQQILLQDVFLRRLLVLIPSKPRVAALAAATLFALAHLPNPVLTPITLLWGFISCLLFLHYRNIIPLAIAHAAFGITLAVTIPSPLIHNMRVGLGFLRFHPHHHYRSHIDHTVSTNVWVTADAPTRLS